MLNGHGGNIYALAREMGCDPGDITDMSSNVNPCGTFPGIKSHLADLLAVIESLPEADAASITRLFAAHYGVSPEEVIPGNGSTQLLYALPRALNTRKALIIGPTYADYASACRQQGIEPDWLMADDGQDFRPDLRRLASLAGQYDTIFICNPNNPTGCRIPPAELQAVFAGSPDSVFIVDESYLPFAEEPETLPTADYGSLPNVIRITSMSKIFKIPGLRIGFAMGRRALIEKLRAFAMPWSVNSLACTAVAYILQNGEEANRFIKKTRAFLKTERNTLACRFADSPHIRWYPSCTSFMLGRLKGPHTAAMVCAALARQRLLIRNCTNFNGLSDRYIRVSLKSSSENRRFGDRLADILEGA